MDKVMVCLVHTGAILVTVPIVLNGETLLCVFITRKGELARVGIFAGKPRDVGPFFVLEYYNRREVPAEAIRDAHKRARAALDEFEPRTDRDSLLAFAADIASGG